MSDASRRVLTAMRVGGAYLCADPDVCFLVGSDRISAMLFQQAIPPCYEEAVRFEDRKMLYNEKQQRKLTAFANEFLLNVGDQQDLE